MQFCKSLLLMIADNMSGLLSYYVPQLQYFFALRRLEHFNSLFISWYSSRFVVECRFVSKRSHQPDTCVDISYMNCDKFHMNCDKCDMNCGLEEGFHLNCETTIIKCNTNSGAGVWQNTTDNNYSFQITAANELVLFVRILLSLTNRRHCYDFESLIISVLVI